MRYPAWHNLMEVYFHAETVAKATEYANILIANDYDEKNGKKMLENIKDKTALWLTNQVPTANTAMSGKIGVSFYNED